MHKGQESKSLVWFGFGLVWAPEDFEGFGSQKNLIFQNAQINSVDHKFKSFAINNRPQISI